MESNQAVDRTTPADYTAGREGAVFRVLPDAGYLRLSGPDRVDFLHRQTTNDLHTLAPGRAVVDVLASPTARIIDVFTLVMEPEALGLVTSPGRAEALLTYLRGKIFFMDNVSLEDASGEWVQIDLDGPQAGDVLSQLGVTDVPGQGEVIMIDDGVQIIGRAGLAEDGYRLLAPADQAAAVKTALKEVGALSISAEQADVLRIEAGLPAQGAEIGEDFTPLEVGLADSVSLSKGCYTGQEVLARQVNYDKVTRQLVGLRLDDEVPPGSDIRAEGRPAGVVTSVALSPAYGWIALAVVKRPHHEAGSKVNVQVDGGEVSGEVAVLPFSAE